MKIIAVGDVHGRDTWKKVVEKENYFDKFVFVGDYFDSREGIDPNIQKINFLDILKFKKDKPENVVLLIGNHDYHYLSTTQESYSGFQEWQRHDINELLTAAIDEGLVQMAFESGIYMFSHAGITKTWCEANDINTGIFLTISEQVNDKFKYQPNCFRFKSGKNCSSFGDDITQSPIWVRPDSLRKDKIDGYIQVVGHTTREEIYLKKGVILIDTIASDYYLEIEGGAFIGKLLNN